MSKGYLIFASGDKYIQQAELCAKSIQDTQTIKNVTIITESTDTDRYCTKTRAKAYDVSPYDETIVIDADMLFLTDISHWWENVPNDLLFTNTVRTYRNTIVDNSYYRGVFQELHLPQTYVALHYFKKSPLANTFYELVKYITRNEKQMYEQILGKKQVANITPSFDFTCALAIKMLDIEEYVTSKTNYPNFVHLKGMNQNWTQPALDWTDKVPFEFNNNGVFIGNYKQHGILHYTEDSFAEKLYAN